MSEELVQSNTVVDETVQENESNLNEDNELLNELDYSESEDESEDVETIDVTNEPLYHILSAFLEDDDGANLIDKIGDLTSAVRTNTKVMSKLLKSMASK
jgi:hypothetical protein